IFMALLTMYRATDDATYLDDARDLADRMIASAVPFPVSLAKPDDPKAFTSWAAKVPGGLRYWEPDSTCSAYPGWRYQLNELQGLRGISELARVLAQKGDSAYHAYYDYAKQVTAFYAMIADGKTPKLDSSTDKHEHYAMNALDLYAVESDPIFLTWAS